tara:strand:- start:73 stop:447 length:375 start_codon:yes stop_codon:yes gene_type:complete
MSLAEGTVAFQNLQQTEVYQGQDTGRYTLTLSLDEDMASKLSDEGVKVKDYEGIAQRKFASKFPVRIVNANDEPFMGAIPKGSLVRVQYKLGDSHPVHATPTYLNAVRVLELGEESGDGIEEGF